MQTATAGTLESMDCLVAASRLAPGAGLSMTLEGTSVPRFRSSMEGSVRRVVADMGEKDLEVSVQDRGALDITLEARVRTALLRLRAQETGGAA